MTLTTIVLICFASLMYLEGMALAGVVGAVTKPHKLLWPLLLFLWPVVIPVLLLKAYTKYAPVIQQLQQNPLFGAMLGLPVKQTQSPISTILGNSGSAEFHPSFDPDEQIRQFQIHNPPEAIVSELPNSEMEKTNENEGDQ